MPRERTPASIAGPQPLPDQRWSEAVVTEPFGLKRKVAVVTGAAMGIGAAVVARLAEAGACWGTSLGTGVAAEMARRGRGGRLVLVTPYTSIPDLVTNIAPFLPAGLLVADHLDTLAKAPSIGVPTIVVHGDADEIVPFRMGERIAATIPGCAACGSLAAPRQSPAASAREHRRCHCRTDRGARLVEASPISGSSLADHDL